MSTSQTWPDLQSAEVLDSLWLSQKKKLEIAPISNKNEVSLVEKVYLKKASLWGEGSLALSKGTLW